MMAKQRSLFAAAFLLGGMLFLSSSASAVWRRYTAAACHYSFYSNLRDVSANVPHANYLYDWVGTVYNFMSREQTFICSVEDSDRIWKENLNTLNVHAYDGSSASEVRATACYNRYDTRGGGCGPQASSGTSVVGDVTLTPSLTMWGSANRYHFGYVQVVLPRDVEPAGGDTSSFNGFFIAGP